jgi:hypothetical protein
MSRELFLFFLFSIAITIAMSGGCMDLRKRWNDLVGKSENEAVQTIKNDGKKSLDIEIRLIMNEFYFIVKYRRTKY